MSFTHDVDVECPDCQPMGRKPFLECCDRNYSGCGVDIAICPECGHGFTVSFKVADVTRSKMWDVSPRAVRDAENAEEKRRERAEQLEKDTQEFERLRKKLGMP